VIHSFRFADLNILLDVESGAIHLLDEEAFLVARAVERGEDPFASGVDASAVREVLDDLDELRRAGSLDAVAPEPPEIAGGSAIKSMCLHVAHDCNLRCKYCSACGYAQAATGPFYCPGDEKVYLDLDYLEALQRKLGATGDFAVAYIIAHEVGHHVQLLMGTMQEVQNAQRSARSQDQANELTVRLELQADFFAGVWIHHGQKMHNFLEEGDLQEALNAASAVGDDRIQMKTQGYVVPDSFTHGTSEQRKNWLAKGIQTGDIRQGDTFSRNVVL